MKNQSGTIKTNLELDRVVMGGSGGYRRLPGGSDHFSLQTHTHHNIYIIIVITMPVIISHNPIRSPLLPRLMVGKVLTQIHYVLWFCFKRQY